MSGGFLPLTGGMKKIVATATAVAVASSLAVAPSPATARAKNCGVVKNSYGVKTQVYREKGKVSCRKARSITKRVRLGPGVNDGVKGWGCWRNPPTGTYGLMGGCRKGKGRAEITFWLPRSR